MQWFYRILPLPWKQGTKSMNRQQEKKLMPFKNTVHFERNFPINLRYKDKSHPFEMFDS